MDPILKQADFISLCKLVEVYIQSDQEYKNCIMSGNYAQRFDQLFLDYHGQMQEKNGLPKREYCTICHGEGWYFAGKDDFYLTKCDCFKRHQPWK